MQQVNLLTEDLRPRLEPLAASQFLLVWAGFAVVLALTSVWQGVSLWSLHGEKATTAEALQQIRSQNDVQRQASADPVDLKTRVAELAAEQRQQQRLLALLRDEQETLGFAAYMKSLATARVEGLWLDTIQISHGARRHVRLSGITRDALHVPELLHNLADEAPFAGQRFESLELEADGDLIEFAIIDPQAGA